MLLFGRASYEHVVCLGLLLDERRAQKMSKSQGNIVVPWDVIDSYGADAFRWYFFTSKQPWDGYRFSMKAIGESVRLFLQQLWNVHAFLDRYEPDGPDGGETDLDRWITSRLSGDRGRGDRPHGGLRRDVRRARDRRLRRRLSATGTCAARAGASGRATRARSRRCANGC